MSGTVGIVTIELKQNSIEAEEITETLHWQTNAFKP